MDPITIGLLAGAALGVLKGGMDQKQEARDRQAAAATQRYQPWTGIATPEIKRGDMLGSTMQGGLAGAMMGQSLGASGTAAQTANAGGGNVWAGMNANPSMQQNQMMNPYTQKIYGLA